jgi:Family of unknown function (DUF6152)
MATAHFSKLRMSRLLLSLVLVAGGVAQAHHSLSGQFDVAKSFEITGVVSRVDWVNPHTYIYVDVKDASNKLTTYKLESLPVAMMRKAGMSKQLLLGNGKPVKLVAHPARNGSPTLGCLLFWTMPDGQKTQFGRVPGAEQP